MTTLPDPPDAWFPSPLAQLSDAFDLAPCGYVLTTVDGHFTLVNHTFLQMTGYARDTLLGGGRIQDVLTPPGRIFYETHYAPLMHMQGRVQELAVDVRCADGQSLPVLLSSTQQLTPSGAVHGYRTVLFPARDRRSYEQELLRARREAEHSAQVKAQMLAMLGHEIGTPVTAISLAAQSLARSAEQGRQQRYLDLLGSATQTLQALVHDILAYSRLEAGTMALQVRPFAVRALIQEVVATVSARAEEKHLVLEVDIADAVPQMLMGDPVKLGQILTNLVSNAVKFTAQGFVRVAIAVIATHKDHIDLGISVTDSGIGIAPEHRSLIFDEFRQASDGIASAYGGTGLGLTISQRLAALYGSAIQVVSQPGVGSTFTLDVSLACVPDPDPQASSG